MSLSVITEPTRTVGASVCRFNSANNRMIFEFQRKDFTSLAVSSVSGLAAFTLDTTGMATDDYIYLYSTIYASGLYQIIVSSGGTYITLYNDSGNLAYISAAGGTDFINSDTARKYYYIEFQIVSGGETYIMKGIPDSTGLITIDAAGVMRRLVNTENDNKYKGYDPVIYPTNLMVYVDDNMNKSFAYKILEKWNGSTQTASLSPDTFYAVNSAIDVLNDSNLKDYVLFNDATRDDNTKISTKFINPTYFNNYFFDFTINCNNAFIPVIAFNKLDQNKSNLLTQYLSVPVFKGLNRIEWFGFPSLLNDGFKFMQIDIQYCESILIKVDSNCYTNPIYVNWLNDLGGREYWLFSSDGKLEIDSESAQTVQAVEGNLLTQNTREFNIPGRANKKIRITQDNLPYTELEGWLDFLRQENVNVLRAKLWSDDFTMKSASALVTSVTCAEKHNLRTGDIVRFYYDTYYDNTDFSVTVTSDYIFTFVKVLQVPASTIIWRKQLVDSDWVSCILANKSEPIRSTPTCFAISFDLIYPSYTRKLR